MPTLPIPPAPGATPPDVWGEDVNTWLYVAHNPDGTINASLLPPGPPRTTTTYTTAIVANGASEKGTIRLAHSYRLLHINTSVACRVRIYTTQANQTADQSRTSSQDPPEGSGVVLDYLTTASPSFLAADLSPAVDGSSMESSPSVNIPITVDLGATGPATVTFTYIPTEA